MVFSRAVKGCQLNLLASAILGALGGFVLAEAVSLLVASAAPSEAAATSISGLARHLIFGFFGGAALVAAIGFGRRYMARH